MPSRLLDDIGNFIFVEDGPMTCDAILVAGGSWPALGEHAAALYQAGYAPKVLVSGRFPLRQGYLDIRKFGYESTENAPVTEADALAEILLRLGVPDDAILREREATYTKANAELSRALLTKTGLPFERLILVCKPWHARRALSYYELAFPESEIRVCPFPSSAINRENWFRSEDGFNRVMSELEKCSNQVRPWLWELASQLTAPMAD